MTQAATVTDSYDAGLLWELPEILWGKVAPYVKLPNRYLIGLSLGHLPPVWPLLLDLARTWQLT
ncbi:MAG: hypothetical protein J4G14_02445 [Dehalococcoidia bacterium]|nr:hypothetical protein [Dehalococcoidia bacterium]